MVYNICHDLTQSLIIFIYHYPTTKYTKLARDPFRTESIISKLCVIYFLAVKFHLVQYSVQVPTWWQAKSSSGLIGAEGLCIGFGDIVRPIGY